MPDRMPSPSSSSPQGSQQDSPEDVKEADNPFAPPPEGSADQPWQPRRPANGEGQGQGGPDDQQSAGGGSRWSPRQPGRSSGGFGQRPGQNGPEGSGGPGDGKGPGLRWDPTDPAQRRARYALLGGMWAFFFALFTWPYIALLLGALSVYWAISSLRAKARTPDPTAQATVAAVTGTAGTESVKPAAPAAGSGRPQTTAAVSGLVTAGLALAIVAATFTAQVVYRDYYTCVGDSLTTTAKKSCEDLLPQKLRPLLTTEE
ncbi:hypothetical protein [Streptomyces sp. NBC_01304]|uniref:hypothetical protein n=1 Tax=Streptomyces sp. NBC_01304 TaxID=2903818 RepID=UPI002E114AE1|nr:hypothetical protein OG430_20330 [Streptomyces sp. NBC_01304]